MCTLQYTEPQRGLWEFRLSVNVSVSRSAFSSIGTMPLRRRIWPFRVSYPRSHQAVIKASRRNLLQLLRIISRFSDIWNVSRLLRRHSGSPNRLLNSCLCQRFWAPKPQFLQICHFFAKNPFAQLGVRTADPCVTKRTTSPLRH